MGGGGQSGNQTTIDEQPNHQKAQSFTGTARTLMNNQIIRKRKALLALLEHTTMLIDWGWDEHLGRSVTFKRQARNKMWMLRKLHRKTLLDKLMVSLRRYAALCSVRTPQQQQ